MLTSALVNHSVGSYLEVDFCHEEPTVVVEGPLITYSAGAPAPAPAQLALEGHLHRGNFDCHALYANGFSKIEVRALCRCLT